MPRPRLLPDLTPFRDSRDLRLVVGGDFISGMGAQAALVALPYQLYVVTHSALLVGLLGAVELGPVIAMALLGGAIAEGLRHVRGNPALMGSFAIDLVAMTFGMPRALFAVLSVSVFHAGAGGTGVLYAAVSAGATVAALLTGWIRHARRLGVIVIWAVLLWGAAVAVAGLMSSLWLAAALLALAGAADSVSAVCRSTINQSVTPDHMRGRMSSVFSLVVTGGPRLGDIESGTAAGVAGVRFSVVSGGLACLVGVAAIVVAFPALARYDTRDWIKPEQAQQHVALS
jgi:hypothetical protein